MSPSFLENFQHIAVDYIRATDDDCVIFMCCDGRNGAKRFIARIQLCGIYGTKSVQRQLMPLIGMKGMRFSWSAKGLVIVSSKPKTRLVIERAYIKLPADENKFEVTSIGQTNLHVVHGPSRIFNEHSGTRIGYVTTDAYSNSLI